MFFLLSFMNMVARVINRILPETTVHHATNIARILLEWTGVRE